MRERYAGYDVKLLCAGRQHKNREQFERIRYGYNRKDIRINGPVITIQGNLGYKMNEMVYVGEHRLVRGSNPAVEGKDDHPGI